MRGRRLLVALLVLGALAEFDGLVAEAQPAAVPPTRLAVLTRGVNLGNWFSQAPGGRQYQHERLRHWIEADEFGALARAGFRHVRFPVEFEMFFDEDHPSELKPDFLADFDLALDHILGAGLAVVVDFHAREDTKKRLRTDDAFVAKVGLLWGAVAGHLAGRDPDRVFLETMNEPLGDMAAPRWRAIQARFFSAMRAAAPGRTIIVTATRWDAIDELAKLEPLPDGNVVYTFHFYSPMVFTHQGAAWVHNGERLVAGLAFPVAPANRAAIAGGLADPKIRSMVLAYAADRDVLAEQISLAAQWAGSRHVPLYCGEFGVYTRAAPPDSRQRWLTAVRELCEQRGIGWAMWDYCGGFRVALGDTPGDRSLDPTCLQALGL